MGTSNNPKTKETNRPAPTETPKGCIILPLPPSPMAIGIIPSTVDVEVTNIALNLELTALTHVEPLSLLLA